MSSAVDTGTPKMLAEVDDGVGWLTFNQPDKHNAMSMEMLQAVPRILDTFEEEGVRAVVVQGAGDKAFISGADISEFGERRTTPEARSTYDQAMAESGRAWNDCPMPVIAMIKGWCFGGGVLTALQCDMRVAADDSRFAVPAARLGLGYGYGGVAALERLVGAAMTAEILFTARHFTADEALAMGLVNRVVPRSELEPIVREMAGMIAENAPLTIKAVKASLREARRDPDKRDLAAVQELAEACFRSEDYREGQAAFMAKRRPEFQGR